MSVVWTILQKDLEWSVYNLPWNESLIANHIYIYVSKIYIESLIANKVISHINHLPFLLTYFQTQNNVITYIGNRFHFQNSILSYVGTQPFKEYYCLYSMQYVSIINERLKRLMATE